MKHPHLVIADLLGESQTVYMTDEDLLELRAQLGCGLASDFIKLTGKFRQYDGQLSEQQDRYFPKSDIKAIRIELGEQGAPETPKPWVHSFEFGKPSDTLKTEVELAKQNMSSHENPYDESSELNLTIGLEEQSRAPLWTSNPPERTGWYAVLVDGQRQQDPWHFKHDELGWRARKASDTHYMGTRWGAWIEKVMRSKHPLPFLEPQES